MKHDSITTTIQLSPKLQMQNPNNKSAPAKLAMQNKQLLLSS
jgi:hypothetical protein